MDDWPLVVIVLLTYQRTGYALQTISAVLDQLDYPETAWYVADSGSHEDHVHRVLEALKGQRLLGYHHETLMPGASWNKGWRAAHELTDLVIVLEDDWELRKPLDLRPYVRLLLEREDVGLVRFGHLAINLDCFTVGHNGIHYLQIQPTTQYQYSGNPALRHRRFFDFYGPYPEDRNPGDTEIAYDAMVRSKSSDGPKIWWPVDIGGWGAFSHIGTEQSY